MKAAINPNNSKIMTAYQNCTKSIFERLAKLKDHEVTEFVVKELIGEFDFASKMAYQMEDVSALMKELAEAYITDDRLITATDAQYGEGVCVFIGRAMKEFYK